MAGDGTATRPADERRLFDAAGAEGQGQGQVDHPPAPRVVLVPRRRRARLSALPGHVGRAFDADIEYGMGFLLLPVLISLGALAYFNLAFEPAFWMLGAALAAALAAWLVAPHGSRLRLALAGAVFLALGAGVAKVETWRAGTQMLGSEISTRLTGRVARIEHQESGRIRLTLDVVATERPQLRYAPARVRVTARAVPEGLAPGDGVSGLARLMSSSGPVRPQSYDFAFNRYFEGIGASGFFMTNPERTALARPATHAERFAAWMETRRGEVAARIMQRVEGPEGAIAAALITGIRAGIPEEANEALRITGLYHVISISGLHMALVAGTVMVTLRFAFALIPSFASRRPVKKYAALAALAATGFYLVASGGDIAAQRSFLMLAVMLVAILFDRAALTMRNLAISALIIVLVSPHEIVGPSFQMSFAATAALIAAYGAWSARKSARHREFGPRGPAGRSIARTGLTYAGGLAMTSVIAGLATALFTAWHFQQVSPLGLVANLTAMPLVSVIVMPMAVFAVLLMPFGLDGLPLDLMGHGIAGMNAIAFWLAERSAFDATGAIPISAVLVLTAALVILTLTTGALRWAALPLVVAGTGLLLARDLPHVMVSEDARLVAMAMTGERVAINRPRPNAFTMRNWMRALHVSEIVRAGDASSNTPPVDPGSGEQGFLCEDGLCVARHAGGAVIAHAADAQSAGAACAQATVIVVADATARNVCENPAILILTARDLAQRGSAQILFRPGNGQPQAVLRHAISQPYRPWHDHRRFSRSARGLAPYQRPQRSTSNDPPQTAARTSAEQRSTDDD